MKLLVIPCTLFLSFSIPSAGQTQNFTAPPAPRKSATTKVASGRFDPYKNFKFRVVWNGRTVAGFSKMSPLQDSAGPVVQKGPNTGGKLPRRTKHEAVTLERGVTNDSEFVTWANSANNAPSRRTGAGPKRIIKDLVLEVFNETGQIAASYIFHRCWASEFRAVPDLDKGASAIAIEHLKLENKGWERQPTSSKKTKTR